MFHILTLVSLLAFFHGLQTSDYDGAQLKDAVSFSSSKLSGSRIAAGQPTTIEKHPYLVSLQEESEDDPNVQSHFCSGGILNENWILTTAHCILLDHKRGNITVRVGSSYSDRGGIVYEVQKTITHELIIWEEDDYDIGLIQLIGNLVYSDVVQPIVLPPFNEEVPAGTIFTIAGWGASYYGGNMSTELREISIPTINWQSCVDTFQGIVVISERMICAFRNVSEGMCDGDGGAPALNADGVVIGIASYTWACSSTIFPTVFTHASKYIEWINANTNSAPSTTISVYSLLVTVSILIKMKLE